MKKEEAETGVRHFATAWYRTLAAEKQEHPSFNEFKAWMRVEGQEALLQFRSVMGADEDAERWFDDELKQNWRR